MDKEIEEKTPGKKASIFLTVFMGVVILAMASGVGFILWKLLGMLK